MKTKRHLFPCFILTGMVLGLLAGCTSDIVGYNLRANFSSFLIGVFSDSVQAALTQD